MKKEEFVRARSEDQKEQRLREIMDATDELFHETSFHGISLTTIADRLGWSRGNLYKYVKTKEEIFLDLYGIKHREWILATAEEFRGCRKLPLGEFTKRWSRVLADHVDLLKYQNLLAIIIETNVPVEVLAVFKKNIWKERQPLVDVLKTQFPFLSEAGIRRFLLLQIYHGCGLYNHIYFSPNLLQALRIAEIPIPEDDFATDFSTFLQTYVRGMIRSVR